MANTRAPTALHVALAMSERQRDAAQNALRDARAGSLAAMEQMQQLQSYAGETEARWGTRADAVIAPEVMYHHRHFMGRLAHAMNLQTTVLGDHARRVRSGEQLLLAAELRLATLKKLIARRDQDAALLEQRRDQKQTDERAMLTLRHRAQTH